MKSKPPLALALCLVLCQGCDKAEKVQPEKAATQSQIREHESKTEEKPEKVKIVAQKQQEEPGKSATAPTTNVGQAKQNETTNGVCNIKIEGEIFIVLRNR